MLSLKLQTDRLDEMKAFYGEILGLTVVADPSSFTIRAGVSSIEFETAPGSETPFYHFALNIAENKMPLAHAWLTERCPLLRDSETGEEQIFFPAWNAHSVYFHDPAGNIVELIARHSLANGSDDGFSPSDILEVSEIGLVVPDRDAATRRIVETIPLAPYLDSDFFLGDEHGLILLPEPSYPWLPERTQPAEIFPTTITITGYGVGRVRFDDLPYEIVGV